MLLTVQLPPKSQHKNPGSAMFMQNKWPWCWKKWLPRQRCTCCKVQHLLKWCYDHFQSVYCLVRTQPLETAFILQLNEANVPHEKPFWLRHNDKLTDKAASCHHGNSPIPFVNPLRKYIWTEGLAKRPIGVILFDELVLEADLTRCRYAVKEGTQGRQQAKGDSSGICPTALDQSPWNGTVR